MISVIVPVFKAEAYLRRCVESVLNQTYRDFELILVDDGSPDNSGAICDEYARKDSRVRVIHKENGGVSSARNAGLDTAKGEYIAFLDSDDWYHPQALELSAKAAEEYGADGITMNSLWTDTDALQQRQLTYEAVGRHRVDAEQIKRDFYRLAFGGGAVKDTLTCGLYGMYRRVCFDGIRFDETIACGEDVLMIFRLNLRVKRVVHLDAALYFYFTGNQSAMRSSLSVGQLTVLDALVKIGDVLEPLPRQAEMLDYRYLHHYFDFCLRVERSGKAALAEAFTRYQPVFLARYLRLRRNLHLSAGEKLMLACYRYGVPVWKKLFGKLEQRMLLRLQGFLEENYGQDSQ